MRISDWSSDVCSSDLRQHVHLVGRQLGKSERRHALAGAAEVARQHHRRVVRAMPAQDRHRFGKLARAALRHRIVKGDDEVAFRRGANAPLDRSEEHTSELQSLMRISYAVFCLKKKKLIEDYHLNDKQTAHAA